jgi:hypothetical protein
MADALFTFGEKRSPEPYYWSGVHQRLHQWSGFRIFRRSNASDETIHFRVKCSTYFSMHIHCIFIRRFIGVGNLRADIGNHL